ncbi:hypothetical protein H9L39_03278 [Fusarium oxysporum f. sp. albedinis]|jgi:hypothetical protein|nr:hypothetical protein H9L39_03278 [Fusarium oxysporum f. sp. albedinis]
MVRPEGGQVSGNKGILNACNLDEFGEGKGSNSLLFSSSVRQALALRTRARWHRRPIGRREAAQGSARTFSHGLRYRVLFTTLNRPTSTGKLALDVAGFPLPI